MKEKKYIIVLIDAKKKAFDKNQHSFMIDKNTQQTRNRKKLPQRNKSHN